MNLLQNPILRSLDYDLVTFHERDVDEQYRGWLHDDAVIQYLEVRHEDRSLDALRRYVRAAEADPDKLIFRIIHRNNTLPVGTISLHITPHYKIADFGLLIGEKNHWGGTTSLQVQVALFNYAFDVLELRRLWGGVSGGNAASHFNYRRLGFQKEAVLRQHFMHDTEGPVDVVYYGILREEWARNSSRFKQLAVKIDE